jgi:hypothetical protein
MPTPFGFIGPSYGSRRLELGSREPRLPDDGTQGSGRQLLVIRDGDRGRAVFILPLHDNMTATPTNFAESVTIQDLADGLP